MSYKVYLVDYIGLPRNHHVIFIETHESGDKTGFLYQVTGNIQTGMDFEHRKEIQPELTESFGGMKELLGVVKREEYGRVKSVVEGVCPPRKQFEGAKRIFPGEPLRRCQEWTGEAMGALRGAGVLH